jgi:molybdopterin-guanine dinucleotide biosynthesis protein A
MMDFTRVILAGGKSERMGQDKALMPVNRRPLLSYGLGRTDLLKASATLLVTNTPAVHGVFGLPMVSDVYTDCGALGGIHAALRAMDTPWALVVACDMPFLNADLLAYQLRVAQETDADAVVPRVEGHSQNLHVVLHRRMMATVEDRLRRGLFKLGALYPALNTRWMDEQEWHAFDPDGDSFANVNTPQNVDDLS